MNEPIKFSNIIKFDLNKCTFCENCIKVCEFGALSIENETINFDNTKCYACKKCSFKSRWSSQCRSRT